MKNKNISFDFDSNVDSESILAKMVSKAYLKNRDFFGQDVSGIKIIFLYTRPQMDKVCGQKTLDWMVGYAKDKQHIYIFSPSVFVKVSNHPSSNFSYVLTHEIAHIFSDTLLGFYYPKWLFEGLAGYVAQQHKTIKVVRKNQDFSKLHDQKNWDKNRNYPYAFSFTKYLVDTFGKERIIRFLKKLPKKIGRHHYPQEFIKFFNQFFKKDFDNIVSKWRNLK